MTKQLTRSINNRKIAGVCGGLGEYFNVDPIFFRAAFLLAAFGGVGIILYFIFWLLMPEAPNNTIDV